MLNRLSRLFVFPLLALMLVGCSEKDVPVEDRPIEQLYNQAQDALEVGETEQAIKLFEAVDRQHPYSKWATAAQLMAAYANYSAGKFDEAIIGLDRFIQLHPSHKDTAYARYLLALSYYDQISDVTRDQKMTDSARKALNQLKAKHPNSKFARDAQLKFDLTYDHLAGKEMEIGRYYMRWRHYLAAINRFQSVIDRYQTTTHVPEALHRLTEAYIALGMVEEAQRTAGVLGHNFPGSEWYEDTYELVEGKRVRPREDDTPWYQLW